MVLEGTIELWVGMFTFFPSFQLCQQDNEKCYLDCSLWLHSGLYGLSNNKRPSELPGKSFIAFSKLLTIPRSYCLSQTSHGDQDFSWLQHWRILKTGRKHMQQFFHSLIWSLENWFVMIQCSWRLANYKQLSPSMASLTVSSSLQILPPLQTFIIFCIKKNVAWTCNYFWMTIIWKRFCCTHILVSTTSTNRTG